MRCCWLIIGTLLSFAEEAQSTVVFRELDNDLLPVNRVLALPVEPTVTTMKRVPSVENLPAKCWGDIFYERHHSGPQHFLICAHNNHLFETYLAALPKLLSHNSHCRITILAPEEEHRSLRAQVKAFIQTNVKPTYDTRDLHFLDVKSADGTHFLDKPKSKALSRYVSDSALGGKGQHDPKTSNSPYGDKYTCIILTSLPENFGAVTRWIHNSRAMLYVPYIIPESNKGDDKKIKYTMHNPDTIKEKLHKVGFRTHEVLTADTMVCAATSDHTSFPKDYLSPGYNPEKVTTPKIARGVRDEGQCEGCREHGE